MKLPKAAHLIASLEPKAVARFSSKTEVRTVLPDVFVEKVGGEYVIFPELMMACPG
jgi:DNA-directed RNA polymerase specialized sigma54-like protein